MPSSSATLYRFVMSDEGKIPADWFAHQVALADRTDGDLDTLSNRLAADPYLDLRVASRAMA